MTGDYYKILGIGREATGDDIKKAYRKLAHQYHPDKKGGNEAKFKELNEAYQILSDPQKKARYDQFGHNFNNATGSPGAGGFDGFDFSQFGGFNREGNFDVEDIFEMFSGAFGGRSGGRGPRQAAEDISRGSDIEINLAINFQEMARGIIRQVELNIELVCRDCSGNGAGKDSELIECAVCKGKGEIRETAGSFFGNLTRIYVCNICRGNGKVPKSNCLHCLGEGRKRQKKMLDIEVPPGIKDGEVLVVRGFGQAGFRNGRPGDLYVKLRVVNDKAFSRVGQDIIYNLSIKLSTALLGAKIQIPTLDGAREIEIPVGAEEGQELRLKGYGIHGRHPGDQIIKLKIEMPKKLSGKARKFIEELSVEL